MKVSQVRCDDYKEQKVFLAVKKAIDLLGGIEAFVLKDSKVLIKPNMLMAYPPEKAVTTHPAVVKAVIDLVKTQTKDIHVGDSPGFGSIAKVAETTGIRKVCDKTGTKLTDFSKTERYINKEARLVKHFQLARIVKEADVVINLPKLKTHGQMVFTGAVKNLFGCVYGFQKPQWHFKLQDTSQFARMIADLHDEIKPQLSIMDAVLGMDGNGPTNGNPKDIGVVIAGSNAYAVDKVACDIVGIKQEYVPVNMIMSDSLNDIVEVIGDVDVKVHNFNFIVRRKNITFFVPKFMKNFIRNITSDIPMVNKDKCIACANCIAVCPAKTINMENKKAMIYTKNCIRCYCCHEMCPHDAVDLKKTLLSRQMMR